MVEFITAGNRSCASSVISDNLFDQAWPVDRWKNFNKEKQTSVFMISPLISHLCNVLAIERPHSEPDNEGEQDLQRTGGFAFRDADTLKQGKRYQQSVSGIKMKPRRQQLYLSHRNNHYKRPSKKNTIEAVRLPKHPQPSAKYKQRIGARQFSQPEISA